MRIQGFQSAQNTASHTSPGKAPAHTHSSAPTRASSDLYSGERAGRAGDIMAGQDLANISRNELKALADRLHDAGVITGEQRLDLTAPHVGQVDMQGRNVADPDEKRDFLADLSAALDAVKRLRPDDASSIAYLQKVNNLANSLAAASGKA